MLSDTEIGEYEIIKGGVLGTGAFATVWKGRHRKDHSNLVAIKAIKKKNFLKSQQLLSKEITILKSLSGLHHKNVVGLLDCVELKDDVCLVMEYCNGGDLADCLHRNGTLSEDTLCSYVKQIGEAMKALQQKGIVHRDLKPQNILLCYEGPKYPHPSEMLLKIADFGFARFIMGGEMATTLCGSPMYMAPEVIMSVKYSAKADLWSIGTILYQCLTGRAPFQAQNPQELKKKYEKSPGLKPNIPASTSPELRDLLMRMLKRDAEERISFEEFFSHPFLQLATAKATSQPMSVPKRRSSSSSDSSTPGKSPTPSPSRGRTSATGTKPDSPSRSTKIPEAKEEEMVTTLTETAGFTKIEKEDVKGRSGRSTPDDYVMVPENLCMESDEGSVSIKRAPLAEEEMASFSASPHRSPNPTRHVPATTTSMLTTTTTTSTTKTTLLATLGERLVKVAAAAPSPAAAADTLTVGTLRPVTLPMTTPPCQSDPISVPSDLNLGGTNSNVAGSSTMTSRSKVKSPDVRMESDHQDLTVATRSSEATRISGVDAVDAGSFSPPAVQFCVGTPPNAGSGPSWRRSSVGVVTPPPYAANLIGSPHRKACLAQGGSSTTCGYCCSPSCLHSPNKMPGMFHLGSSSFTSSHITINTTTTNAATATTPFSAVSPRHDNSPTAPLDPSASFNLVPSLSSSLSGGPVVLGGSGSGCCGYHHYHTVPDNMVALAGRQRDAVGEMPSMDYHRVSTDSSLLSHQVHNQNRQGMMVPYPFSRERHSSCSEVGDPTSTATGTTPPFAVGPMRQSPRYGSAVDLHHLHHHNCHPYHHHHHHHYHQPHPNVPAEHCSSPLARGNSYNVSPPAPTSSSSPLHHQIMMAQSPPRGLGLGSTCPANSATTTTTPLRFVPQPLCEETLMDDNHNETLGKLSFVLDLVECILDLARTLGSALRSVDPSEAKKMENMSPEHYSQYRSSQRSLEQLVLYARACHLLNSALHMARDEIRNDRLQQSTNLRTVLSEMNSYYHHVVERCKSIHRDFTHNCKTPLTQKLVMATADKLIYNQAIQMCQTAALDEFSNNSTPENTAEVVRRYQVAQILLHSLAQTARNENDKHMLIKYRKSVESRLSILTSDSIHFDRSQSQHQHHHHQHQPQQHRVTVDNQHYHQHL